MSHDIPPAIVRDFNETDSDVTVVSTTFDSVSHTRGWGTSGYRVQVVEHDCPADHCSFDRMVRRWDVRAEIPSEVRYWCLNPNCAHFVRDGLSHACHGSYPHNVVREPAVFEGRKV